MRAPLTSLGRAKAALLLPLGLLRLLLAVVVLLLVGILIPLAMVGVGPQEAPGPLRRQVVRVLAASAARTLLFLAG